jgi:protein TonB
MAPILKEVEAPVGIPTASAPAAPPAKPANEAATRPQPVALEIPVTVNGARTVDGSDKRVPFSESTQTVLIFPHGAVIRTGTPLANGQLVFLTNEKTKKEVVCQVVKSKSSGSAGAYVELQFTEPAPSFWGLQIPGSAAVPPAPRLATPTLPAAPKVAAPTAAVTLKPPVASPPVLSAAPMAISTPAVKPVVPPAPVASEPEPAIAASLAPAAPVVAPLAAPPAPVAVLPPVVAELAPANSVAPVEVVRQTPAISEPPAAPPAPPAVLPVPPIRDYSKQIEAIFAAPELVAPAANQAQPSSGSSEPSSEDLKQQASRLQAQLRSMLFTEAPSASPASTKAPGAPAPLAEIAEKLLEIAPAKPTALTTEPKPAEHTELKPALSPRKLSSVSFSADEEEVKIPSWLAPLSQNSEAILATESAEAHEDSVNSGESYDARVGDSARRPQTVVFGGHLLGEDAAPAEPAPATRSKKGLIFGLIAATILLAGGGWYFLQNHSLSAAPTGVHSSNAPSTSEPAPVSAAPSAAVPSAPAGSKGNSSAGSPPQPSRNSAPASEPPDSAAQPKNSKSAQRAPEPVAEPAKPSLGEVHLGAPVVNHSENAPIETDGLQSVATSSVPAGSDPFAAAGGHHNAPVAPLPLGGDVKPAELLKSVPPQYPTIAKAQHISGKVTLDAQIDASGNVTSVKLISGPALLHRAALEAVKQWKYKPAQLDGEPTPTHLAVTVEFRAQ